MKRIVAGIIALLPSRLTPIVLRVLLGYNIGKDVKIGLSIIDVKSCRIGNGVRIGHGNLFIETDQLEIGNGVKIGHLNVFRGGSKISIGDRSEVIRLNVINSIVDPEVYNDYTPEFCCGQNVSITEGHKIDFTDRVSIGNYSIVAGRNSSLWTHVRQATKPIEIGDNCYLGSEIRVGPGVTIADRNIVAMGSVVTSSNLVTDKVIGGVPAKIIKDLDDSNLRLLKNTDSPELDYGSQ